MVDDTISRRVAIDALIAHANHDGAYGYIDAKEAEDTLKALPTAEPRWIPVAERVPEIDMSYPHHKNYLVKYDSGDMDVASWSNVNRFWTNHVTKPYWNCVQFAEVVAWMPLPTPWKGEKNEQQS